MISGQKRPGEMRVESVAGKVLFVTGDGEEGPFWASVLERHGLEAVIVEAGSDLLEGWEEEGFDLALVDAGDRREGLALCRRLRASALNPILLLAASCDEAFCLEAYRAGADECIQKPVGPAVLVAKVAVWLRQAWTVRAEALEPVAGGGIRLDPVQRKVVAARDEGVQLTALEFRLLHLLMSRPGQVLAPEAIVRWVWGRGGDASSPALHSAIYRLRRKIEADPEQPRYIQTVSGQGYAFCG